MTRDDFLNRQHWAVEGVKLSDGSTVHVRQVNGHGRAELYRIFADLAAAERDQKKATKPHQDAVHKPDEELSDDDFQRLSDSLSGQLKALDRASKALAEVVIVTASDEAGRKLFLPADLQAIAEQPHDDLRAIAEAGLILNGIVDRAEAKKD